MEDRDDYKYLKIRDAILSINQKVSLIGAVIECGIPKRSRGSDCFCSLKICDDSHPKPGIAVNIFGENMESLPCIASLGDIVQVSNVTMKTHKGEAYALFNKKFSSFALYKGNNGENFLPYQVSSKFLRREQDKKLIAGLRKWLYDFQLDEDSNDFLYLREVKERYRVNLACKILHMSDVGHDTCLALVWDGTDTPPTRICTKPEDYQSPFPLEFSLISKNLLRSFPATGSILRVTIDQNDMKHVHHLLKTGKWVKLISLFCQVEGGLWHGKLNHFTRLRYISSEDHLISERLTSYERRLQEFGQMPYWSFPWPSRVTEINREDDVPLLTLRNVLVHSKVPLQNHHHAERTMVKVLNVDFLLIQNSDGDLVLLLEKFLNIRVVAVQRCVVRFIAVIPLRAEDFRSPHGTYRVRFTLEDPTARIHAFVYAADGENFFDGYPSVDLLNRKMNKLLGVVVSGNGKEIKDAPRNPPWVECCLKSYYLDRNKKRATRSYRIFDTKLLG